MLYLAGLSDLVLSCLSWPSLLFFPVPCTPISVLVPGPFVLLVLLTFLRCTQTRSAMYDYMVASAAGMTSPKFVAPSRTAMTPISDFDFGN